MSVIRLELTVPDDIAADTANKLARVYVQPDLSWPAGCTGASVEILDDERNLVPGERMRFRVRGQIEVFPADRRLT